MSFFPINTFFSNVQLQTQNVVLIILLPRDRKQLKNENIQQERLPLEVLRWTQKKGFQNCAEKILPRNRKRSKKIKTIPVIEFVPLDRYNAFLTTQPKNFRQKAEKICSRSENHENNMKSSQKNPENVRL